VASNVDSTGTVNFTSPVLENKSYIRCSHCHDVHGLRRAQGASALPNPLPKPYLRGTWLGNPYPPDLPPMAGYTYPTTGGPTKSQFNNQGSRYATPQTVGMPRFWAFNGDGVSRGRGGYFIDQNTGFPTAGKTVAETAGLCLQCHGTGASDGAKVDTMDYYGGSTLWRAIQVNGHSNSALGGTGTNKRKIFDARRGTTNDFMMQQQLNYVVQPKRNTLPWGNVMQSGRPGNSIAGQRAPVWPSGWWGTAAGGTYADFKTQPAYLDWYAAPASQVAKTNYHAFTCSKCHSPHAAGLPSLLISNCLDTRYATWTANSNRVTAMVNGAANCHRNTSTTQGNDDGWHRLKAQQSQ